MPRTVDPEVKIDAITMIMDGVSQREISRETGLSRQYIRNLAKEMGIKFLQNGKDIRGNIAICENCGCFFRRPKSKLDRAQKSFCNNECRVAYQVGVNHPNWRGGKTLKSFSSWVVNQKEYKDWRDRALERAGHKCEITGKTENLQVHHIFQKAEEFNPERVFDDSNALVLWEEAHTRIHQIIKSGVGFEEAVEQLRREYRE